MIHQTRVVLTLCTLLVIVVGCGGSSTTSQNVTQAPALTPTTAAPAATATVATTPTEAATATTEPSQTAVAATPPIDTTTQPDATAEAGASDLPALSPENAPQTPDATATEPSHASEPTRIIIPAIGLDLPTVSVGLDAQQVPIVPKHDVGWFTGSSMPGDHSNIILWGHVLRWLDSPSVKAPFEHVHDLQPGAEITIVTADGQEHRYKVTEQLQARPEETELLYPTLYERLTLVSCIGDKVIQDGTLTKEFRLVTLAVPIRDDQS